MPELYLFTWNLHKSQDAYDLVVDHLTQKAQQGLFVACLQEVPGKSDILAARDSTWSTETNAAITRLASKNIAVAQKERTDPLPRGLALVHHRALQLQESFYDCDTEFIAAVFSFYGKLIAVIGLHGLSQASINQPTELGGNRALLRHALNACDFVWQSDHVIVLGDWNSNVRSLEISSWHCFYVLSGESQPRDDRSKKDRRGFHHKPLFMVKPKNISEDGTIRYVRSGSTDVELFDFIAVDQKSLGSVRAEILTNVMSQPIWDSNDPMKDLSDHRPVEGYLTT